MYREQLLANRKKFVLLCGLVVVFLLYSSIAPSKRQVWAEKFGAQKTGNPVDVVQNQLCMFDEQTLGSALFAKLQPVLEKESAQTFTLTECTTVQLSATTTRFSGSADFLNESWRVEAELTTERAAPQRLVFASKGKNFVFTFPDLFSPCFFANLLVADVPLLKELDLCGGKLAVRTFAFDSDSGLLEVTGSAKVFGIFKLLRRNIVGFEELSDEEKEDLARGEADEDVLAQERANAEKLKVSVRGVLRPAFRLTYTYEHTLDFGHLVLCLPSVTVDGAQKTGHFNALFFFDFFGVLDKEAVVQLDLSIRNAIAPEFLENVTTEEGSLDSEALETYLPKTLSADLLVMTVFVSLLDSTVTFFGALVRPFAVAWAGLDLVFQDAVLEFRLQENAQQKFVGRFVISVAVNGLAFLALVDLNKEKNKPLFVGTASNDGLRTCFFGAGKDCEAFLQPVRLRALDPTGTLPDLLGLCFVFVADTSFEYEMGFVARRLVFSNVSGLTFGVRFEITHSDSVRFNTIAQFQPDRFVFVFEGTVSADGVVLQTRLTNFSLTDKVDVRKASLRLATTGPALSVDCELVLLRGTLNSSDRVFAMLIEVGHGYWFVQGSHASVWPLSILGLSSVELRTVTLFATRSEDFAVVPVEYKEEFGSGETADGSGGFLAMLRAEFELGKATYTGALLFSRTDSGTCLSFSGRKKTQENGEETETLDDFSSSAKTGSLFASVKLLLPKTIRDDLFSKPVQDFSFDFKATCVQIALRCKLMSESMGPIKVAFAVTRLGDAADENPLYKVSVVEPNPTGFLVAFLVVPDPVFDSTKSKLFEHVSFLNIHPPTLVLANKRLDVRVPVRRRGCTKECVAPFVFTTRAGLSLFAKLDFHENNELVVSERFANNESEVSVVVLLGPSGVLASFRLAGTWQVVHEATLVDSHFAVGAVKSVTGWKVFLKFQTVAVLRFLNKTALAACLVDANSQGVYLLAKVCKLGGDRSFTKEESERCGKLVQFERKAVAGVENERTVFDPNDVAETLPDTNSDAFVTIGVGSGKTLSISKLQFELKAVFGANKKQQQQQEEQIEGFETAPGVYVALLGYTKKRSFELGVGVALGAQFGLVLEFYSLTGDFVGLGTVVAELLGDKTDVRQNLSSNAMPQETVDALNNKLAFKYFKAHVSVANLVVIDLQGLLKVYVEKYGRLVPYSVDVYMIDQTTEDPSTFTFEIVNLEDPAAPPLEFVEAIAVLVGAQRVVTGYQSYPRALTVEGAFAVDGTPLTLYLNRGFYILMVFNATENEGGSVTAKTGLATLVLAGVVQSVVEWRLSLFLNVAFRVGPLRALLASVFVDRLPAGFGIGLTLQADLAVAGESVSLFGELGVYLVAGQAAVRLRAAMLEDRVEPFGLGQVIVSKTTLVIMCSANLNPIEFLLDSGLTLGSFRARFTLYWNTGDPSNAKTVFFFALDNFSFAQLLTVLFGSDVAQALSFLEISFKRLSFYLASSSRGDPVVVIPETGMLYDVGFSLVATEMNLFGILRGNLRAKVSDAGILAKGEFAPFGVPGLLRVSGPLDKEDLEFDFVSNSGKLRVVFRGKVEFLLLSALADVFVSETKVAMFAMLHVPFFEVEMVFMLRLVDSLTALRALEVFVELLDSAYAPDRETQSLYYKFRTEQKKTSVLEKMNQRPAGNQTDQEVRRDEAYGDDVKAKREKRLRDKEEELDDAKEDAAPSRFCCDADRRTEIEKKQLNKLAALEARLNTSLCENMRGTKNKEMRLKEQIDDVRLRLANKHSAERLLTLQLFFGEVFNFFKWLINKLKKAVKKLRKLLRKITDLIKKLVSLLLALLKAILSIRYIIGYAKYEVKTPANVPITVYVEMLLFTKIRIQFCTTVNFGKMDNVEKEAGSAAKENNAEVSHTKEDIDDERKAKLVDGEQLNRIKERENSEAKLKKQQEVDVCEKHTF